MSYFEEITNSVSRLVGGYFHPSIKKHRNYRTQY